MQQILLRCGAYLGVALVMFRWRGEDYTETVKPFLAAAGLALGLLGWPAFPQSAAPQGAQQPHEADEQEPPEEDESLKPKQEYTFNPLQAESELKIGAFYFKRGSFRAAAMRFEEATKWNPGSAEAWRRLGEAREKLESNAAAVVAYHKFLELAPESKEAAAVKKKLASLDKKGN